MRPRLLLLVISLAGYGGAVTIPAVSFHLQWDKVSPLAPKVHDEHHNPAVAEAVKQLRCMLETAYYAADSKFPGDTNAQKHKASLAMIHEVFGKNARVDKIKQFTEKLATGGLIIAADNYPNPADSQGTFAITDGFKQRPGQVYIMSLYHAATHLSRPITVLQRARILIHEASHALFETWDNWSMKEVAGMTHIMPLTGQMATDHFAALKKRNRGQTLTDEEKSHIHDPMIAGYWHEGYSVLKDVMSESMHSNADSWPVFGYRCVHGRLPHARDIAKPTADPESVVW